MERWPKTNVYHIERGIYWADHLQRNCIGTWCILSCTMELANESASFVMIFVLFCFHLGLICGVCFSQKGWKSFYSYEKNKVTTLYEVFNRLQAFIFLFFVFYFLGINEGIKRKHILRSLVADQSTDFLARSLLPPQRNWENVSTVVKNLTPESRWLRFLDHV